MDGCMRRWTGADMAVWCASHVVLVLVFAVHLSVIKCCFHAASSVPPPMRLSLISEWQSGHRLILDVRGRGRHDVDFVCAAISACGTTSPHREHFPKM